MSRRKKEPRMHGTAAVATIKIDNPYYSPSAPAEHKQTTALRSLRDDPLGWMHSHNQISDAQYLAGRRWQELTESSEISGPRTLDLTQTPVDGSPKGFTGLSKRQDDARKELQHLRNKLGTWGTRLVTLVLIGDGVGRKWTVKDCAGLMRPSPTYTDTKIVGHRFRECLSTLATEMGFTS